MEDRRAEITARFKTIQIPDFTTVNKKYPDAKPLKSYWVEVRNMRTGYVHTVSRSKAHRYVNNRPTTWSYVNPLSSFKDTYGLVK